MSKAKSLFSGILHHGIMSEWTVEKKKKKVSEKKIQIAEVLGK